MLSLALLRIPPFWEDTWHFWFLAGHIYLVLGERTDKRLIHHILMFWFGGRQNIRKHFVFWFNSSSPRNIQIVISFLFDNDIFRHHKRSKGLDSLQSRAQMPSLELQSCEDRANYPAVTERRQNGEQRWQHNSKSLALDGCTLSSSRECNGYHSQNSHSHQVKLQSCLLDLGWVLKIRLGFVFRF